MKKTGKQNSTKYIFVVGGVMSGVGKGITASSIGNVLQQRGYRITACKIDPYVNVDAGTMNPTEHGEVFVLADGYETDQDMGNYERFMDVTLDRGNYMTTGSVYQAVITKERNLEYKGKCVQVVPDIPKEVLGRLKNAAEKNDAEVVIVEIGGTVGEYENILFLEAIRMLKIENPADVLTVMVSYVPAPSKVGEMKTKPTQHAVRTLNGTGIQPDIIIARAETTLDQRRREKIALFCNVREQDVISAPDVESIYDVPLHFEKANLSDLVIEKLTLPEKKSCPTDWQKKVRIYHTAKKEVRIAVVGKYFKSGDFVLSDVYISIIEALRHAGVANGVRVKLDWLTSDEFEADRKSLAKLKKYDGVLVPGGFGSRGIEGKIQVIEYCRKNRLPFFGICYGMQLAVVEYGRNILGLTQAHTVEVNPKTPVPIIDILPEQKERLRQKDYGGSMRLGSYKAKLQKGSQAAKYYGTTKINERHRHRYEVNPEYLTELRKGGLVVSGTSPNGSLAEIIELPTKVHPFFMAVQFHPEFQSSLLKPHPLFVAFVHHVKQHGERISKK
jgi:CTP synthase